MPHRLTTIKRFRISNDVLILILEKLNPVTLYRTCQAFSRVFALVMEFQHLRYKFELAVTGMKDGPASYSTRSPFIRLQLLMAYKKDWPKILWTDEQKVKIPAASTLVGVSGNFLYSVGNQSLDLVELPSCRTGRPPSQTRHMKYNTTPQADCVAVDSLQSLIIASHTYGGPNGHIGLRLKIRNLWTFDKHPKASAASFDCSTQVSQPVAEVSIVICANRVVVSIDFVGGSAKHLLMDWRTLQAMWLEEQDVIILNPYYILGARTARGKLALNLYNVSNMASVTLEREYELPPIWAKATLRFSRNTAPSSDIYTPSTALFYSDPSSRVLLLTAKQAGPTNGIHWMFVPESYFQPTSHPDRRSVPWSYWNQFCLIRDVQSNTLVGHPQVTGSRVVYLEKEPIHPGRGHPERARLSVIDFSPCPEATNPPSKLWSLLGKQSVLIPNESHREIPTSATNGVVVEGIRATEDNIVLLLENRGDIKPVNILTFGVPAPKTARHDTQYHPAL
ncbi:hypothetical protein B0H34DRAFT_796728 [Crassisporium funariophilum]|nr:hypothetical protein B0H34DRAFT_796728 [Crassisporium funariophilum]